MDSEEGDLLWVVEENSNVLLSSLKCQWDLWMPHLLPLLREKMGQISGQISVPCFLSKLTQTGYEMPERIVSCTVKNISLASLHYRLKCWTKVTRSSTFAYKIDPNYKEKGCWERFTSDNYWALL